MSSGIIQSAVAFIDVKKNLTIRERIKKQLARGRGFYVVIMALQTLIIGLADPETSSQAFFSRLDIEALEAGNIYSKKSLEKLKKRDLDVLLLIGGFGILKSKLLEIPKEGVLSYHHGDMRSYRGMPPAFWELYHDEQVMGVTLQKLSAGLDKGLPIVEISIPILSTDSWESLRCRAFDASTEMMRDALVKLSQGTIEANPIEAYGRVFTLPSFSQWLNLTAKVIRNKIRAILKGKDDGRA